MAFRWHVKCLCVLILVLQPASAAQFADRNVSAVDLASKVEVADKEDSAHKGSANEAVDQDIKKPTMSF
eukprot:Skav223448  [mRNA]  locus=scaffold350:820829:821643:- [translate_table: standard]